VSRNINVDRNIRKLVYKWVLIYSPAAAMADIAVAGQRSDRAGHVALHTLRESLDAC
tara:strand:+ start:1327 stop:1497 length:171 start_codon:yes stop_codon:yes gene_type:complete